MFYHKMQVDNLEQMFCEKDGQVNWGNKSKLTLTSTLTPQDPHRPTSGLCAVSLQSQQVCRQCYQHGLPLHPAAAGPPRILQQSTNMWTSSSSQISSCPSSACLTPSVGGSQTSCDSTCNWGRTPLRPGPSAPEPPRLHPFPSALLPVPTAAHQATSPLSY